MVNARNRLKICVFFTFFLAAAILLPALAPQSDARKPLRWRAKKTVVIDPGHGGRETGVRGPGGMMEKDITLEVARRIESELKRRFKVSLTRTDDYGLEIIRRTDIANHLNADAFISLHTGGSFRSDARGLSIYYFREYRSAPPAAMSKNRQSWDQLQLKHVKNSRALAETLRKRLQAALPAVRCDTGAAPLLVLRGADMPAVLIEVGTLTHTADEKRLTDKDHLTLLGQAIADGIIDFSRKLDGGSGQ